MSLLEFDRSEFHAQFGHTPFLVRHSLAGHELFSLERLVELSRRLPASRVEYNAGNVPLTLDPAKTPRTGLSAQETIRRINECSSWMVLKNVEQDAEFAALLDRCLAEVGMLSQGLSPGLIDRESFIFISSPGSVTPYHMDPEQNFLLQIRGSKTMRIFNPSDPAIFPGNEVERFYSGAHRNLVFREEIQSKAQPFELVPGLGVHVPVTAPHWVQNGPEVSISYSVTFQTKASLRKAHAHRINAGLRRLGLRPFPVGQSAGRDRIKQFVFKAQSRAKRMLAAASSYDGAAQK